MNLYVGNLAREVTEDELKQEFAAFGQVTSVSIIKDKYTGQARGFAFVEMPSKTEGQAAILGLKGKMLLERTLEVNEAQPRADNRNRGSYGDRKGGSSYGDRRGGGGGGGGSGGGRRGRY